jgi:hypothetical protein
MELGLSVVRGASEPNAVIVTSEPDPKTAPTGEVAEAVLLEARTAWVWEGI